MGIRYLARAPNAVQVPYNAGMSSSIKSRRLEARLDAEADALIAEAARVQGVSKSEFVIEAARDSAVRVLARADATIMSDAQFDILIESLDEAVPMPNLARAASLHRPFIRT